MLPSYAKVICDLQRARVPVAELGTTAKVAVTLAAGRVIALAFSQEDENLMWSHPQLGEPALVTDHPEMLKGGLGGDRLWFAPELSYHWHGQPDWDSFSNYSVPLDTDPGNFRFANRDAISVKLRGTGSLRSSISTVRFEVLREVRMIEPPVPTSHALMSGVDYVGIETSHRLKFAKDTTTGRLDLWHLLQVPVGSILIVPFRKGATADDLRPLSYGPRGSWEQKANHLMWRFGGEARTKVGLSAAALTGRSAVFRQLNARRWCMIIRDFPVNPDAIYADHPFGMPRFDQAFQAWDGFGFGEMEFHSPMADAEHGPRELQERDRLWAFGGSPAGIAALAFELLHLDVGYICDDGLRPDRIQWDGRLA